jgi:3-oxoacyl-[acyl-carrier-protein] synthase II
MNQVVISAVAAVTGLGDTLEQGWGRLLAGESAIAPVRHFACDGYLTDRAACVPDLERQPGRSRLEPLLERLLAQLPAVPGDCRLLTASTKGPIDLLEDRLRGAAVDHAALLLETLPRQVAARCGLADPGVNIGAACASSTIALARAGALIAAGRCSAVLVVCADLVSEFVFSGFSALQGLSPEPCRPFDQRRCGLSLGEGAAALLLCDAARARREGWPISARLLGWGVANDANHITAPARDGCGLVRAVEQALASAGLDAAEVAAISAHGTGTLYNDAMEMTAFERLFGDRPLPFHSLKGALGHSLGASGGIEAAVACRSLEQGVLPPTVGCDEPDPAATGRVGAFPQHFAGDVLLSTNSGFGGINAALLLGRGGAR